MSSNPGLSTNICSEAVRTPFFRKNAVLRSTEPLSERERERERGREATTVGERGGRVAKRGCEPGSGGYTIVGEDAGNGGIGWLR